MSEIINKQQIKVILKNISNINRREDGEQSITQLSGKIHENMVKDCFMKNQQIEEMTKKEFKKKLKKNKINNKIIKSDNYPGHYNNFNSENTDINKTYLIHQPFGGQEYPDFILAKFRDNTMRLLYVECKSDKKNKKIPRPQFNNNPPKKNINCIYIINNKIYNGYFLKSLHDEILLYRFFEEYKRLCDKYNKLLNDYVTVDYKKAEPIKFPPTFYNGKEFLNKNLNLYLLLNLIYR